MRLKPKFAIKPPKAFPPNPPAPTKPLQFGVKPTVCSLGSNPQFEDLTHLLCYMFSLLENETYCGQDGFFPSLLKCHQSRGGIATLIRWNMSEQCQCHMWTASWITGNSLCSWCAKHLWAACYQTSNQEVKTTLGNNVSSTNIRKVCFAQTMVYY